MEFPIVTHKIPEKKRISGNLRNVQNNKNRKENSVEFLGIYNFRKERNSKHGFVGLKLYINPDT